MADKRARINRDITSSEVRVIGADAEQIGVLSISQALELAAEASLDLVEVAPQATPPVCRIMDHGKYVFDQKKKKQSAKTKQKQVQLKEVKFRPGTEQGDYQVKLRSLVKFLNNGDRAKVTLRFRGREVTHPELGRKVLEQIEQDLAEIATVEQMPRMEGRQMVMLMAPKKH